MQRSEVWKGGHHVNCNYLLFPLGFSVCLFVFLSFLKKYTRAPIFIIFKKAISREYSDNLHLSGRKDHKVSGDWSFF